MKHYHGARCGNDIATIIVVELDEHSGLPDLYALPMYTWIRNHSPSGFEWGYRGSGPAQAAFAILYDHLGGRKADVESCYQIFHSEVTSQLADDSWCITGEEIEAWLLARTPPTAIRSH